MLRSNSNPADGDQFGSHAGKFFTYQGRGTTTVMRSQRAIPKRTIFVGLVMCFLEINTSISKVVLAMYKEENKYVLNSLTVRRKKIKMHTFFY